MKKLRNIAIVISSISCAVYSMVAPQLTKEQLEKLKEPYKRTELMIELGRYKKSTNILSLKEIIASYTVTGANANIQDPEGNTALHHLFGPGSSILYDSESLKKILDSISLDPNIKNNNGETALMVALRELARERQEAAINVNTPIDKLFPKIENALAYLIDKMDTKALNTQENNMHKTALMEAVEAGSPFLVEHLLKKGADRTLQGFRGITAQRIANNIRWTSDEDKIQKLLQ